MEILITALILGLMGSFHCVGMCGPIALSLPLRGINFPQKLMGGFLYNFGRILTYGIAGLLFGMIGQGFHFLGFQQLISILMGSIMIISVLFPVIFKHSPSVKADFFTIPVRRAIQDLFRVKSYKGLFLIGLLNGLLPCGLVYMAIAGAIGTGNVLMASMYMVLFGLGTLPMLLMISLIGNMISLRLRNKMSRIVPIIVIIVGIMFILRGLSLGIPMLSPPAEKLNPAAHIKIDTVSISSQTVKHACCQSDTLKK